MIKKNKISILIAFVILFLSLSTAKTFEEVGFFNIPYFDKIVHMGMYFTLMLSLIIENRSLVMITKYLLFLAIIPVLYGIIIEFMQSYLTVTRGGEILDVCFNILGTVFAIMSWILFKYFKKSQIK